MLERVSRTAALDESARDRLGRALAVLARNLPAHADPSQSDLREVERHLVDMLPRVGSMPGPGEIKTAVWEAWGRLAGERRLLAPTERLRLAEQHAEVRAVALGIFAARGYDAASLPHLVAELDRTLSDPWAAWVRFPMAPHWRRAFDDSVSSTASYLDDPEGASNEANFLEESMLLDVRSAMAGSWGWDRSDARGRRTCPFPVSSQGTGGSTHAPYRSGIQ